MRVGPVVAVPGGPPVTGEFTPASLSGLKLWLRADVGVTGATTASAWANQASTGAAFDVTQGTPSAQPTIISSWKNGKPALDFDGVDDSMNNATAQLLAGVAGSPWTVLLVGANDVDPDVTDRNGRWGSVVNGNIVYQTVRVAGTRYVCTGTLNVSLAAGVYGIGVNPFYALWSDEGSSGANNLAFRANGAAKTTTSPFADAATTAGFGVGGSNGGTFLDGKIGEIMIYNRVLTAQEIASLEAYIVGFWGAF